MSARTLCRIALIAVVLGGCAPRVQSDVLRFHTIGATGLQGSFAIVPDERQRQSLEFKSYAGVLAGQLARHNLVEAGNPADATYIVKFDYRIDRGRTNLVSTPVYGQTGTIITSYGGSTTSTPTYGYVGTSTSTVTTFTRDAHIGIFTRKQDGSLDKIHETKIRSVGTTSNMAAVMPYMLQAAFKSFPGRNGTTETITLEMQPAAGQAPTITVTPEPDTTPQGS